MKDKDIKNTIISIGIILQYLFIIFLFFPNIIKPTDSSLIRSIHKNDVETFKYLINKKSWINKKINLSRSISGSTPLRIAIMKKNLFFVKEMLDYGADPNGRSDIDDRPEIITAVNSIFYSKNEDKEESLKILKLLIERGANVNSRESTGGTPLHLASRFLMLDAIKILINKGAIANIVDNCSFTPLSEGILYNSNKEENYYEMIKILIDNGSNTFYGENRCKIDTRPIEIARNKNDLKLIKILEEGSNTEIPIKSSSGEFILNNVKKMHSILCDYGLHPNIKLLNFIDKYKAFTFFGPILFSALMYFFFRNKFLLIVTLSQITILLLTIFIIFPVLLFLGLSATS